MKVTKFIFGYIKEVYEEPGGILVEQEFHPEMIEYSDENGMRLKYSEYKHLKMETVALIMPEQKERTYDPKSD